MLDMSYGSATDYASVAPRPWQSLHWLPLLSYSNFSSHIFLPHTLTSLIYLLLPVSLWHSLLLLGNLRCFHLSLTVTSVALGKVPQQGALHSLTRYLQSPGLLRKGRTAVFCLYYSSTSKPPLQSWSLQTNIFTRWCLPKTTYNWSVRQKTMRETTGSQHTRN